MGGTDPTLEAISKLEKELKSYIDTRLGEVQGEMQGYIDTRLGEVQGEIEHLSGEFEGVRIALRKRLPRPFGRFPEVQRYIGRMEHATRSTVVRRTKPISYRKAAEEIY